MGGADFEICDNLRHKINVMVDKQTYPTIPTMTFNHSTSGFVTFKVAHQDFLA